MKKLIRKMTALLLTLAICGGSCIGIDANAQEIDEKESSQELEVSDQSEQMMSANVTASDLKNPIIEKDDSMEAGQKVTWDCVWFGSYPQSEITSSDPVYNTLQNASGWDDNNDIIIGETRYRRMKKEDATHAYPGNNNAFYKWGDPNSWHYFKYEPIKWRVLKKDNDQVMLLSDIALDDQRYNSINEDITWETSTIRSWLNGYGSSSNQQAIDYGRKNFISCAFTSGERSAIKNTPLINSDSIDSGIEGGNNTVDQIFLLSEEEVYGNHALQYGFVSERTICDEARVCKSSTYTKAMGVWSNDTNTPYKGNCWWWLRSPGDYSTCAAYVEMYGNGGSLSTSNRTFPVASHSNGLRPALNLNLSSDQWTYAGTVCSDGTIDEKKYSNNDSLNGNNSNQTIIDRVSEYTSDEIYAQFNMISESNYSYEKKWQMWLNLFTSYGITDVREGIRYLSNTTDKRFAYLNLTTDELFCANNFQYMLDHTTKGHLMRAALIADGLVFNNEINDWLDFTTIMDTEYPGVAKYKAMLYDFMGVTSDSIEIQSDVKLISDLSKNVTGAAKIKADNLIKRLNACKNVKEETEILKSSEALDVWTELSKKRDDNGNVLVSYQLDKSSGFGQFEKAMGYSTKTISIVDMTVTDILDFLTLDSKLAILSQYRKFLKDIVSNKEYIPFQMRWAASIILTEIEEGYWGKIKDIVIDIIEQTGVNSTVKEAALAKAGASSFSSWLAVINIESFFINKIADIGGMVKNEAYVEGYSYLANAFKTQLERSKQAFIQNKTEENAWNFYYNYNILYRLRYKGEESYLAMTKVNGIAGLFSDYGNTIREEVVNDTLGLLRERCQFTFDNAKAIPESCQFATKSVIKCPVDVGVYTSNGELAALLKDGKESDITNDYGRFVVMYDSYSSDYIKIICLNDKENYNFKLIGTDEGLVNMELIQKNERRRETYAIDNAPVNENTIIEADIKQITQEKTYNIDNDGDGKTDEKGTISIKDSYILVDNISLNYEKIKLKVGESRVFQVLFSPLDASVQSVSWQSANPKIATVIDGKVKALSVGTTIVSCVSLDAPDIIASCEIMVVSDRNNSNKIKVSKISLSGISKKIAAGKKVKLTANISPSNATNKALTWKSSNTKVATVNSQGVVTMKKNSGGKKVIITAIANDGSRVKGTYKITSMKGVIKKLRISGDKTMKAGKSQKLKAYAKFTKGANTKLKWTSNNTKYAKVNSKGAVKAYKKGKGKTVKITALATDGSNKKSSIKIKIK